MVKIALLGGILMMCCVACTGYKKKDGKIVFSTLNEGNGYGEWVVEGADVETFKRDRYEFAHDAKHAYHRGILLEGIDGATFRQISYCYIADKNNVYYWDGIVFKVEGADPATFKVREDRIGEDKKDIYYFGNALHVADKSSFVIMQSKGLFNSPDWAKDKTKAYYLRGKKSIKIADYETFAPAKRGKRSLWSEYACDKVQVYFMDSIVRGADPKTFVDLGESVGQDKNHVFVGTRMTNVKVDKLLEPVYNDMFTDGKKVYDRNMNVTDKAVPKK